MKTPRVLDFDPDAKASTLKSSLENMPAIQKPNFKNRLTDGNNSTPITTRQQSKLSPNIIDAKKNKPNIFIREIHPLLPVPPVRVVPLTKSNKRHMKQRHPFDIYHDQYDSLKELAMEDRRQGGLGSMSAMVREAIDKFISEKRK